MNRTSSGGGDSHDDHHAAIIAAFRRARDAPGFSFVDFWRLHGAGQTTTLLSALVKIDLQLRFDRGEVPNADEYLKSFPDLTDDADRALSLIYEEFCLLEENRLEPRVSEFISRYKPWSESLASQLNYHHKFSQIVGADRPKVRYPAVGERFASYVLCSILGKGGGAQVYLATDDLGGRKVVLKVSPFIGLEPAILASLEHRNIVSIFTVVEAPELGLRGICMPYKSGITLEALLADFAVGSLPRKAVSIRQRLDIGQDDPFQDDRGWKDFPTRGTYTEAVAWVGLMICNALAYLHRKGVFHRDIKPANILLTHSEGPLLFDFNLAHTPNAPEHARDALNGGTLPYMAPEQLRAFLDPDAWGRVGAPADIYALGLVLRELVTGAKPDLPNKDLPLGRAIQDLHDRRHDLMGSTRSIRPDLPPALDAIIANCLSFRPEERYKTALEVGEDLRRFLDRKPLLIAKNGSLLELTANWTYRHRKRIAALTLVSLVCALGLILRSAAPDRGGELDSRPNQLTNTRPNFPAQRRVDHPLGRRFDRNSDQFRAAVELLDSPDPASWRKAETRFDEIGRGEPTSAWPLLYRSLSLQKLGQADKKKAVELWMIASQRADAVEAIEYRLEVQPNRVPLLLALAEIHQNKNELGAARRAAGEALKIEPRNGSVLARLGNIALREGCLSEAITHYIKAIEATPPTRSNDRLLTDLREQLIKMLIVEIDRLLATPPQSLARDEAEVRLAQLEQQINDMKGRSKEVEDQDSARWLNLNVGVSLGVLNSGRGYIHTVERLADKAVEEFILARKSFGDALSLVETFASGINNNQGPKLDSIRRMINRQQSELERRIREVGLTRGILLPPANPGPGE